jgi:hypothetical protein
VTDETNDQLELPIVPYSGTGGYAYGSDTSRARAELEASDGTLSRRQEQVLSALLALGPTGATWKEMGEFLNLHHGQVSGALSNLHRAGLVFQLRQPRHRCMPYVHRDFRGHYDDDLRRDSNTTRRIPTADEISPMVSRALVAISEQTGLPLESLVGIPEVETLLAMCRLPALD